MLLLATHSPDDLRQLVRVDVRAEGMTGAHGRSQEPYSRHHHTHDGWPSGSVRNRRAPHGPVDRVVAGPARRLARTAPKTARTGLDKPFTTLFLQGFKTGAVV